MDPDVAFVDPPVELCTLAEERKRMAELRLSIADGVELRRDVSAPTRPFKQKSKAYQKIARKMSGKLKPVLLTTGIVSV